MKKRLFTLMAVLALIIAGLLPIPPSVPVGGFITPFAECQDGNQCTG